MLLLLLLLLLLLFSLCSRRRESRGGTATPHITHIRIVAYGVFGLFSRPPPTLDMYPHGFPKTDITVLKHPQQFFFFFFEKNVTAAIYSNMLPWPLATGHELRLRTRSCMAPLSSTAIARWTSPIRGQDSQPNVGLDEADIIRAGPGEAEREKRNPFRGRMCAFADGLDRALFLPHDGGPADAGRLRCVQNARASATALALRSVAGQTDGWRRRRRRRRRHAHPEAGVESPSGVCETRPSGAQLQSCVCVCLCCPIAAAVCGEVAAHLSMYPRSVRTSQRRPHSLSCPSLSVCCCCCCCSLTHSCPSSPGRPQRT